MAAADKKGIAVPAVADFESPLGKGALGVVDGKAIVLGNAAFLKENGVDASALSERADELRHEGATAIYMASTAYSPLPIRSRGRRPRR